MNSFAKFSIISGICTYATYKFVTWGKGEEELKKCDKTKLLAKSAIFGAAVGLTGTILSTMNNFNATCNKLNIAADNISNRTAVEIEDDIVAGAVAYAADKKASQICNEVAKKVERSVESDMHKTVAGYINNVYSNVKGEVRKKLRDEVAKIDIKDLREEVIDEAKAEIASRFSDDLDELSDKYADNLNTMSDIYSTVADSIRDKFKEG